MLIQINTQPIQLAVWHNVAAYQPQANPFAQKPLEHLNRPRNRAITNQKPIEDQNWNNINTQKCIQAMGLSVNFSNLILMRCGRLKWKSEAEEVLRNTQRSEYFRDLKKLERERSSLASLAMAISQPYWAIDYCEKWILASL